MWRDVVELATLDWVGRSALILFVLLPVAALVLAFRGHRAAWISLAITGALLLGWWLYYGTGWWETMGAGKAFTFGGLAVTTGWLILGWELAGRRLTTSADISTS